MCLVAFCIEPGARFPFVLAANRDEFFNRPAAPMAWWDGITLPRILAGRDLDAGGTWLGLSDTARLALLTNIRNPREHRPDAASRGALIPACLRHPDGFEAFFAEHDLHSYNGFNLVGFDFARGEHHVVSTLQPTPHLLPPGCYGLSNASLDTPWPKVQALKQALRAAVLSAGANVEWLIAQLLHALADERTAADARLPSTGVPLDIERALSAAHVRLPGGHYGTRCATVIVSEQAGSGGITTTVIERSFQPSGEWAQQRFVLDGWPAAGPR